MRKATITWSELNQGQILFKFRKISTLYVTNEDNKAEFVKLERNILAKDEEGDFWWIEYNVDKSKWKNCNTNFLYHKLSDLSFNCSDPISLMFAE
jgi:hypothetical protein